MYLKGTRLYSGLFLICVCTIGSRYIAVEYNTILNKNTKGRKPKLCSDYELTKDTPYLTLTGELWGAFSGFFREKLLRDIENILLCRDSDTLRKPKKSSSTGRVALKYFNRIFFSVHNIRCRSYHNLVYDRTMISNRQVLTIWYELVIYILNLGIWNFVYVFGMNPPDVLVGYVHRRRKSDLGRLYISRASTHASLRIFFNNKGMFI